MTRINLFQKRSEASKRGWQTRRARDQFVAKFGQETLFALSQIQSGKCDLVCSYSEAAKRRYATFKANLTRGAYYPFAYVRSDGRPDNKLKLNSFQVR